MAFTKITDYGGKDVASAPDILTGTAQENKEIFDRALKEVAVSAFNSLLDELAADTGASNIGASVEGVQADNIAAVLSALRDRIELKADESAVTSLMSGKQDKQEGKDLSANDFTDELKNKLDGIEQNAERNNIGVIWMDGIAYVPQDGEIYLEPTAWVDYEVFDKTKADIYEKIAGSGRCTAVAEYTLPEDTNQVRVELPEEMPVRGVFTLDVPAEGCPASAAVTLGVTSEEDVSDVYAAFNSVAIGQSVRTTENAEYHFVCEFYFCGDRIYTSYTGSSGTSAVNVARYGASCALDRQSLTGMRVTCTAALPAGTVLRLYKQE